MGVIIISGWTGRPNADDLALPRAITNEILHEEKRTPGLRGEILGADYTWSVVASRHTVQVSRRSAFLWSSVVSSCGKSCLQNTFLSTQKPPTAPTLAADKQCTLAGCFIGV